MSEQPSKLPHDAADPDTATARSGLPMPRDTTPTWEVELLISGVAVFAMLQLPGWLDGLYFALAPRFDQTWATSIQLIYIYSKSAAVILAVTFVLHLLLRAYWIALVGVHSVHPDGVLWDRLKMGSIQREITKQQIPSFDTVIERADNRSTTAFAIGVSLAMVLLILCVAVACLFGVTLFLRETLQLPIEPALLLGVAVGCFMLPLVAAQHIDRHAATRIREGGLPHRLLSATLGGYARLGLGRGNNAVILLLGSHGGERRMIVTIVMLIMLALGSVILGLKSIVDPASVGSYEHFPDSAVGDARFADPAHYDNLRDAAHDPAVPYLQSDLPREDFLRLMVPYQPRNDDPAMQRTCAASTAGAMNDDRQARRLALIECLQQLHPVSVDGQQMKNLRYELSSDPKTDRPALLAMIDLRRMTPGRHELTVSRIAPAPSPDSDGDPEVEPNVDYPPYRIPFWR